MNSISLIVVIAAAGLIVVVMGVLTVIAIAIFRRGARQPPPEPLELVIDVASLVQQGPSTDTPRLVYMGKPVRLAALVVAPVGRSGSIPDADRLLDAVDHLIPGLVDVISRDSPVVKFWPGQLSTHGFAHAFFRNVKLPGNRGIGTRWCSIAGKFKSGGQQFLAGLLCDTGESSELSEIAADDNEQWARVLEVRRP
ncbi:MAG: hypothetical protein H6822_04460 [Planctomycetaceae bacterium]|nr:hypothetical protein [Planctomycetales bacterium]MCB9921407.1 hypothetical protein [Planctomycetaceae bacterium]